MVSMEPFDLESYVRRSRSHDVSDIVWDDIPRHPLPAEAVRTLHYMQDIESHTIIYLRELLSTRAVDDPDVATFLACWIYEETFHGRALERFLIAAGHPVPPRQRSQPTAGARVEALGIALISKFWPDFVAVHMTWGAINELTTLTGYRRLAALADHPILSEILARIMRDESRHFGFYFQQAQRRLANPRTARITRFLVEHFWDPVGSDVQPSAETRFLARYLFADAEGRAAAHKVDETVRTLPGFENIHLLEAWLDRNVTGTRPAEPRATLGTHTTTPEFAGVPSFR